MEDHNHIMEQGVHGVLREAIHRLGQGLVRTGVLEQPDDILHLSMTEIGVAAGGGGRADLHPLVEERTSLREQRLRLWTPAFLGSGPPPPPDPRLALTEAPAYAGLEGQLLRGVGASPGRATGRARVASMQPAPPDVEKGDILVAFNAGPAWTPIFPLLGGLVLDAGAVFQHAALVAREYGIPTVIMTRDATKVIVDG